jgi:hypothetical protein
MELTLTRQSKTQVDVTCDDQPSHTFDLSALMPAKKGPPQPVDDPLLMAKLSFRLYSPLVHVLFPC